MTAASLPLDLLGPLCLKKVLEALGNPLAGHGGPLGSASTCLMLIQASGSPLDPGQFVYVVIRLLGARYRALGEGRTPTWKEAGAGLHNLASAQTGGQRGRGDEAMQEVMWHAKGQEESRLGRSVCVVWDRWSLRPQWEGTATMTIAMK